jgi:hypothetical protein
MDLYTYGTGLKAVASFHGLNGHFNDNATMCYDLERGQGIDPSIFKTYAAQLKSGDTDWSKNDIAAVFQAIVDDGYDEVDITGVSLGGMAVIRAMAFNDDPDLTSWPRLKIKSCGIVCGKDDRKTYESFAKVVIKAWHGTSDPTMPYVGIETLVNKTTELGGNAVLQSLDGVGHDAWSFAYNNEQPGNYYDWLASFYTGEVPPEIIDPPVVEEDPVLSFVIVDGVGKAYTESGAIYDVPVTKVV